MKCVTVAVVLIHSLALATYGAMAADTAKNCVLPQADSQWSVHRSEAIAIALRPAQGRYHSRIFTDLDMAVCGTDGSFPTSIPTLNASMPMHGHGTNYDIVAQQNAPGRYRIDGLNFHMSGQWRINVAARVNGKPRSVSVAVQVEP